MFRKFAKAALSCLICTISTAAGAQDDLLWREVDPENLVFMELPAGTVAIELNPVFASRTSAQFRELVGETPMHYVTRWRMNSAMTAGLHHGWRRRGRPPRFFPVSEQMSTADRAAGAALIAAAAGTVLAMAHHPTGAHGGVTAGSATTIGPC